MDKITHEVRLAQWAEVVKQCQARPSGMSANTWLKENGIAVKSWGLTPLSKNITFPVKA